MLDFAEEPALVLRPRFLGEHMRRRWRYSLVYLPLALISLARVPLRTGLWIVVGAAVFGLARVALAGVNRLTVSDGSIRRRSWLGITRSCAVADVAEVVEVEATLTVLGPPEGWLLFVGPDGRTALRAMSGLYGFENLDRLQVALAVPWQRSGLVRVAEVERAFPGSFSWPWRHYWLTFLGVMLAGFVLLVFVLAAFGVGG